MADGDERQRNLPPLAVITGSIGFVLTAGLIGFVGWEAVHRAQAKAPAVEVRAKKVHPAPGGFVLEFEARNTTAHTAAAVQVEGTLTVSGAKPVVSSVTLDYVPGHSTQEGGMFFPLDPRSGQLDLRALGYSKP